MGEAGCCALAAAAALPNARPPRPASPAARRRRPLRPRTSPEVAVSRAAPANRGRVCERRRRARRAGRGARRGPREFANRGRRRACSLQRGAHKEHLADWVGPAGKRPPLQGFYLDSQRRSPAPTSTRPRAWPLRAMVPPAGGESAPLRIPYSQAQERELSEGFGA